MVDKSKQTDDLRRQFFALPMNRWYFDSRLRVGAFYVSVTYIISINIIKSALDDSFACFFGDVTTEAQA